MRILFVTDQALQNLSGTSLRIQQLLQMLPSTWEADIAVPNPPHEFYGHKCINLHWRNLEKLAHDYDAVLINLSNHAHWLERILRNNLPVILDSYNLFFFELQFLSDTFPYLKNIIRTFLTRKLAHFELRHASHILVSHPRQLEYARKFTQAPASILPVKMPDLHQQEPQAPDSMLAHLVENHPTFTLGGGLWPWYDYLTLFQALRLTYQHNPCIRVIIHTSNHHTEFQKALLDFIAGDSVLNQIIFVQRKWLDLPQRLWVLQRCYGLLNCQVTSSETLYSYRTRVADAILHGLPVITTAGDYFADFIEEFSCGNVYKIGDYKSFAQGMLDLVASPSLRAQLQKSCLTAATALKAQSSTSNLSKVLEELPKSLPPKNALARRFSCLMRSTPSYLFTRFVASTYYTPWKQWVKNHLDKNPERHSREK